MEPTNAEILQEIAALKKVMKVLVNSLPILARATADNDLKRVEAEKAQRRKESAAKIAGGQYVGKKIGLED